MKIFWNASCVPEAAVRTNMSIGPPAVAPGTCAPVADAAGEDRLDLLLRESASVLPVWVTMQIASLAILLKTSPPGSLGFGSRDDMPIVTRPRETSATPTSEPPWRSLKSILPSAP